MGKPLAVRVSLAMVAGISAIVCFVINSVGAPRIMSYIAKADGREIYVLDLNEQGGGLRLVQKAALMGNAMPMAVTTVADAADPKPLAGHPDGQVRPRGFNRSVQPLPCSCPPSAMIRSWTTASTRPAAG